MATRIFTLVAVFCALAGAQQPNSAAASMVVNGVDGAPFPIVVTFQTNALTSGLIRGHASVPFVLARSTTGQLQVGATVYFGNSFDLPVSPSPEVVMDGLLPGSPFHTDANGNASLSATCPPSSVGSTLAYQAAVGDPSSPYGFTLTSAIGLTLIQGWTTTTLTLGDDSTYNFSTSPLSIPFYGASYTHVFICSNGYVTFGTSDGSDYTPSNWDMAVGPPRIAGFWTDLECPANAVVVTTAPASGSGPGFVRVDYNNVHDYAVGTPHTFSVQIYENGLIQIIHPPTQNASVYDQLVGISPGGILSPPPQKDLSAISQGSSYLGAVNEVIFEWFGIVTQNPYYTNGFDDPYDLAGKTLTFLPAGVGGSTSRYLLY